MASSDFQIDDQTAQSFRIEVNEALQALATNNSRSSTPPTTYPYMWWYDESTNILRMRNGANDDWIDVAFFNQLNNEVQVLANSAGPELKLDIYTGFLQAHTTDDLTEGLTKLFFTDARARNAISVNPSSPLEYNSTTGVMSIADLYDSTDFAADFGTKTTSDLSEGTNKYYTDERVDDRIATLINAPQTTGGIDITYNDSGNSLSITHANTSNQSSLSNVIMTGISLDGYGHVTGVTSVDESTYIQNVIPVGVIVMWSGAESAIPNGWVLCNGANGTPNLQDRFIVGAGDNYNVGATGGASYVNLQTRHMPAHNHSGSGLSLSAAGGHTHTFTGSTNSAGAHTHTVWGGDGGNYSSQKLAPYLLKDDAERPAVDPRSISTAGNHSHTISATINSSGSHSHGFSGSTGTTGGSDAHENRPPYYALCFIMKI